MSTNTRLDFAAMERAAGIALPLDAGGTKRPAASQGHVEASQEPEGKVTAIPSALLRAALEYADLGYQVIPLHTPAEESCSCGKPDCASVGKHPRTAHGLKDATCDRATIRQWWDRWPDANVGIRTGPESGIFILDIDGKEGETSLIELAQRGCSLPDTFTVRTGRGSHFYFLLEPGADVRNSARKIARGLDIRGAGGYVVAPPSKHSSGTRYEVAESSIPAVQAPKWLLSLIQTPQAAQTPQSAPAAGAVAGEPIGKGGRTPRMVSLAGTMNRRGMSPPAIEAALIAENAKCNPPLPEQKIRAIAHDIPARYPLPLAAPTQPSTFSDFLQDPRPKVRLRGDNRLLSDLASDLGTHLSQVLYTHIGEVVELLDGSLHPISAQRLRTLAERHVVFYRVKNFNENTLQVGASMDESDARGILVSPQFIERLSPICHVNTGRRPVIRSDGRVDLLPEGYDREASTLTNVQTAYAEDMDFSDAVKTLIDLYSEFRFSDGARSRSVAVAALLGLYAKQLVAPGELRPAFTYLKNAEGSGATTLAACAIVPVLGDLPIGVKATGDDEMRKAITSAVRCGKDVLFLDNLKGQLNSPSLEAFVSAATWTDRLLGSNEHVTGPNIVTVFCTANGLSISPDWRRRSLFAELHLSEERAEDRVFKRPLSVPVLKSMRAGILAACWSLVRHWDALGRPQPTRSHSAFPAWAATIGGIVEAAGFGCPFETAKVAIVADEDGQGMRTLTAAMTPSALYTSGELVALCRTHGVFDGLVGSSDSDFARPQRSAFGKLLARYHDRLVGGARFVIEGTGHAKRFQVTRPENIEEQTARRLM